MKTIGNYKKKLNYRSIESNERELKKAKKLHKNS